MSEYKLTLTASNLDRFDPENNITKWLIKSLNWQTDTNFNFIIADSGSFNYEEIKEYLKTYDGVVPIKIVQHKKELFSRSFLNNLGIRTAINDGADYIATTDQDMLFGKDWIKTVRELLKPKLLIQSRTLYFKGKQCKMIYKGELDFCDDIDSVRLKHGRLKKRTTLGGFQCMHKSCWQKIHGFDERYKVWGSEDFDLMTRIKYAGFKIKWMGDRRKDVMVFHQAHPKKDIKRDLEWQNKNKKFLSELYKSRKYKANPDGEWGGFKD